MQPWSFAHVDTDEPFEPPNMSAVVSGSGMQPPTYVANANVWYATDALELVTPIG